MEYYSAMKKNGVRSLVETWVDPDPCQSVNLFPGDPQDRTSPLGLWGQGWLVLK